MAVRNFWVDADIDGRQTMLSGGPKRKDGGMEIHIYQRDDGSIFRAFYIQCNLDEDGNLITAVYNRQNGEVTKVITRR